MKQEIKHNCTSNQFNQQIENITIELEDLNEKLNENIGALNFKLTPPIVRELNTVHGFTVKGIITSTTTWKPVRNITGDTWTGTITFNSITRAGNPIKLVVDGNDVKGLIIETED